MNERPHFLYHLVIIYIQFPIICETSLKFSTYSYMLIQQFILVYKNEFLKKYKNNSFELLIYHTLFVNRIFINIFRMLKVETVCYIYTRKLVNSKHESTVKMIDNFCVHLGEHNVVSGVNLD